MEAMVTKCERLVGDRQNRIDEIKDRIFADFSTEVPLKSPPDPGEHDCIIFSFTSSYTSFSQSCT